MRTWRESIASAMMRNNDSVDNIVAKTVTDAEMDEPVEDGHGNINSIAFTIWTRNHVYFSVCYGDNETIGHVRRNPVDE